MFNVILASGGVNGFNAPIISILGMILYFLVSYCIGVLIFGLVQYALSKLKSKVPGMILPILNGICAVFGLILTILGISESATHMYIIVFVFSLECILNVIIFTVIYKKCRANMTNTSELEKMTVQDLD